LLNDDSAVRARVHRLPFPMDRPEHNMIKGWQDFCADLF
jgi:hypothetical protein